MLEVVHVRYMILLLVLQLVFSQLLVSIHISIGGSLISRPHPKNHGIGQNVLCSGRFIIIFFPGRCGSLIVHAHTSIVLHKRMYKWALPFGCSKK